MRKLALLAFLALVGCGDPFADCAGLSGDDMQLCIARANAVMAWRRGLGDSLRAASAATAQQPVTTCQAVGVGVVQCR